MRNLFAISGREFRTAFLSPLAYVVLTIWMGLLGILFYSNLIQFNQYCLAAQAQSLPSEEIARFLDVNRMVVRVTLDTATALLLFLVPLLTMRALADERRLGTAEFLLTSPVTAAEVVWGKFLAILGVVGVMLLATLQFPLFLYVVGSPDWGPIATGYLGLFLFSACFIATGIFASSLTENPLIAAILGFCFLLLALLTAGLASLSSPPWSDVLTAISPSRHYEDFLKGIVDTGHIVFFASWVFFFNFATQRVVESQRWR